MKTSRASATKGSLRSIKNPYKPGTVTYSEVDAAVRKLAGGKDEEGERPILRGGGDVECKTSGTPRQGRKISQGTHKDETHRP